MGMVRLSNEAREKNTFERNKWLFVLGHCGSESVTGVL